MSNLCGSSVENRKHLTHDWSSFGMTSSFVSHSCFDIRHYSLVIVSSRFKIKLATAA